HASAVGASEGERADKHCTRRQTGEHPHRQRHNAGQIEGCHPFPEAIEHKPRLRGQYGSGGQRLPSRRARARVAARKVACFIAPANAWLFAKYVPAENVGPVQRENSSWLSLATRSNASLGFLMRY